MLLSLVLTVSKEQCTAVRSITMLTKATETPVSIAKATELKDDANMAYSENFRSSEHCVLML